LLIQNTSIQNRFQIWLGPLQIDTLAGVGLAAGISLARMAEMLAGNPALLAAVQAATAALPAYAWGWHGAGGIAWAAVFRWG
jgi:hypothetical protein